MALGGLRSSLEHWIAVFVGWQPGMKVNPLPQEFVPCCLTFARQQHQTEQNLPFQSVQKILVPLYKEWAEQYGENFLQQLRFEVELDSQTQALLIPLRFFDTRLEYSDEHLDQLGLTLREALERYKEVIFKWPNKDWVTIKELANPANSLRLGKFSNFAYPRVNQAINEEDPFVTAAFSIRASRLEEIFRLDQGDSAAVYVWAEEANAARIADKIRFLRQQEPKPFSAKVVSFMRDTRQLYGFMMDLAENRIRIEGQKIMLNREGQEFEVGSTSPQRPSIKMFEDVVRQVVALGVSLKGEQLPLPPPLPLSTCHVTPEEAVKLVEQNQLAASESPEWAMWKDVIMGLVLEID